MRATRWIWLVLAVGVLAAGGCQTQVHPRIVRLTLNVSATDWQLSVDGARPDVALSNTAFRQKLVQLRLRQGDVMLLELPPAQGSAPSTYTTEWLWGFCQSNSIAVYLLPEPLPGVDMFSVRAYHWTAPYENPFDLANASFYREGHLLGHSTNGFEKMLQQIAQDRPSQVFILGSQFDRGGSFPPGPAPYEHQRERLYDVLRAAGTDFVQLDALP